MILASHQPAYLPYLGLFYKMTQCDKFMFMDHLQFEIKLYQNRNYVRSSTGRILLTVPVLTKGRSLHQEALANDLLQLPQRPLLQCPPRLLRTGLCEVVAASCGPQPCHHVVPDEMLQHREGGLVQFAVQSRRSEDGVAHRRVSKDRSRHICVRMGRKVLRRRH
jgi:hypothetical protein